MIPFTPPLNDINFLLNRLIGIENVSKLPGYDSVNPELVSAVLEEASKIASEVFGPLNDSTDKVGVKFANNTITMPPGCKEAYKAFIDGGWNGLPVEESEGGQGLPWIVAIPVQDMLQGANVTLALCPLLNQGAIELLSSHGNEALKRKYLPKLVNGEWAGTMNLTESQAGSDVGAITSKAIKDGDSYKITGQKVFISFGDHDMAENIIHFVLARLPGAPEGTRGLSLFLVPKIMVNDDGSLGKLNDLRVVSIEHKMGMHAGPTCVMAFGDNGGATGYLVGAENGGINAMFTMMNNARIGVGVQALGTMERSYQQARDYAKTRVQGRNAFRARDKRTMDDPLVTIINHPDVRRMLLWMKSHTEAARALAYSCAYAIDVSKRGENDARKAWGRNRVDLLTPIVKAWITDLGNEVTSVGVQVHGGMGYVEETGAAQHMRDCRVLAIYEGTNGIHANDLVFRKIAKDGGATFSEFLTEMVEFLPNLQKMQGEENSILYKHLVEALAALSKSGAWILQMAKEDPAVAAAVSAPFLRLMGNAVGGYYLARCAYIAQQDLQTRTGDPAYLASKLMTARFYAEHVLPQCEALASTVMEGAQVTLAAPEEYF